MPGGRGSEVYEVFDIVGPLGFLERVSLHHELAEVLLALPHWGSNGVRFGWGPTCTQEHVPGPFASSIWQHLSRPCPILGRLAGRACMLRRAGGDVPSLRGTCCISVQGQNALQGITRV